MREIVQALVVLVLAIPFIYMTFDIAADLAKRSRELYRKKAKPAVVTIVNSFIK